MTICACLWRRLVEEYASTTDILDESVTERALHVLVPPLQRKTSSQIMVKGGRTPPRRGVAIGTFGDALCICKLISVDLFVAGLALAWGLLEVHIS